MANGYIKLGDKRRAYFAFHVRWLSKDGKNGRRKPF